jgi:glycine oxidase
VALKSATGIDNGYRRSGGLYLARTPGEAAALAAWAETLREEGIEVERIGGERLLEVEPGLRGARERDVPKGFASTQYPVLSTEYSVPVTRSSVAPAGQTAFLVPSEAQIRNPWHLRALAAACIQAGVVLTSNLPADEIVLADGEIHELLTIRGPLRARQYCFTAGAWTGPLLAPLGIATGIVPIRGQMVLFRCGVPPVKHIINVGSRYLVPRADGRVLAGSTEEEAGFDKRTTDEAIADLTAFAREIIPALRNTEIERTWAGLRPGSFDGLPYLGRLPGLANAFVASGHFRSGLFLSPATAVVMAQAICGEATEIDLSPFRVGR